MRHSSIISTLIVGQHPLLREGLAALLQHSTYKVIASAGRACDLKDVRVAPDRQPLAILTIDDTDGSLARAADNISTLRARFTSPTIVVVSGTRNSVDIQQIMSLMPNAYIANVTSRDLLFKVLDLSTLAQMVLVLSSITTTAPPPEPPAQPESPQSQSGNGFGAISASGGGCKGGGPLFSQREQQILNQLAQGKSNKEIARLFGITESTVKVHLKALLRKIGARNRTQAAIWALAGKCLVPSGSAQGAALPQRPFATEWSSSAM